MDVIASFLIAVATSVVSHFICKWLDNKEKKDNK